MSSYLAVNEVARFQSANEDEGFEMQPSHRALSICLAVRTRLDRDRRWTIFGEPALPQVASRMGILLKSGTEEAVQVGHLAGGGPQ